MKLFSVIGFIAVLVSVFLISGKNEKVCITPKATLYLTIAFIGNGMCSTVQKMQQLKFSGGYKNEFMIVALLNLLYKKFRLLSQTEFLLFQR